jgi:hypothetical protein
VVVNPPPADRAIDDALLVRYLVGATSDAETEWIDELSVADETVAARVAAVENDLVDQYVAGALRGETRERFEAQYLSSAAGRAKVQFAQTLRTYTSRADEVPVPRRMIGRVPGWALAAVLVLAAATAFLFVENARLRRDRSDIQAARAGIEERVRVLQERLTASETANGETARQLALARQALAHLDQRTDRQRPAATLATFLLRPATRGAGNNPAIAIPRGANAIVLQLAGEADDFAAFRAELKAMSSDAILWRSGRIPVGTAAGEKVVAVTVPSNLLKPQQYLLQLVGIAASGSEELLSGYPFRIVSP